MHNDDNNVKNNKPKLKSLKTLDLDDRGSICGPKGCRIDLHKNKKSKNSH